MRIKTLKKLHFTVDGTIIQVPQETIIDNATKTRKISPCCTYYIYTFVYNDKQITTSKAHQRYIQVVE
jgi:hypothetical protein